MINAIWAAATVLNVRERIGGRREVAKSRSKGRVGREPSSPWSKFPACQHLDDGATEPEMARRSSNAACRRFTLRRYVPSVLST